eukprot:3577571-Prymnesium_polylepis.1
MCETIAPTECVCRCSWSSESAFSYTTCPTAARTRSDLPGIGFGVAVREGEKHARGSLKFGSEPRALAVATEEVLAEHERDGLVGRKHAERAEDRGGVRHVVGALDVGDDLVDEDRVEEDAAVVDQLEEARSRKVRPERHPEGAEEVLAARRGLRLPAAHQVGGVVAGAVA